MKKSILFTGSDLLKKLKLPDNDQHKKALEKSHTDLLNAVHDLGLYLGYLEISLEKNLFRMNIQNRGKKTYPYPNVFAENFIDSIVENYNNYLTSIQSALNLLDTESLPTASRKDKKNKSTLLSLKTDMNTFIDDAKDGIMMNKSLKLTIAKSLTESTKNPLDNASTRPWEEFLFDFENKFENHWLYNAMVVPRNENANPQIKKIYFRQNMVHEDIIENGLCNGLAYDFLIQQNNDTNDDQAVCAGITLESQFNAKRIQTPTALKTLRITLLGSYPSAKIIPTSTLFSDVKEKIKNELTHNKKISLLIHWLALTKSEGHAFAIHKKNDEKVLLYDANAGITEYNSVESFIDMLDNNYMPALTTDPHINTPAGTAFKLERYYSKHTAKNFWYHFFKYHALNPWYYLTFHPLFFLSCTAFLLSLFFPVFGIITLVLSGCLILGTLVTLGILPLIKHGYDSLTEKIQSYFPSIFPVQNLEKPNDKLSSNFNNANPNEISMNKDGKEKKSFNTGSMAWSSLPPPPPNPEVRWTLGKSWKT